jgi:phosphate transport system substrate-binding protein
MRKFVVLLTISLAYSGAAVAQLRYSGSDTLEPVVDAARVAFARAHPNFKLTISSLGSSSGIRELCTQKAVFVGSSRAIKPEETKECTQAGVIPIELVAGLDAVVLVVSSKNTFLKELSMDQLKALYSPQAAGKLLSWKALLGAYPDTPLRTVGVGIKHGTFEFFHGAIGNGKFVRSDFKDTQHHEETAKLVGQDAGAIGYLPLAVAKDFAAQVRIVKINFGEGPIEPTEQTIASGSYGALARSVYFYVNPTELAKASPDSRDFVKDLTSKLPTYTSFANMVPLSAQQYEANTKKLLQKP